ncbi:hypothetical protein FHS35_008857 [Streptomyces umbrinus]|uniref:hypothetical protein n=1 Tax=Streptomyces phaeochromogenes group TaxID=2838332 RepID=UPI00167E0E2C|nr:hypothetical protein [Streptomyces umbrinus]MCR3731940.1 hypothetical protein [Streptomyces umbrinus]WTA00919.1 hypothetical protein OHB08_00335 [Streptomyces phaeochromogenes]GHH66525.1 hypothetical protein GCM10018775_88800 [Streptomyces umbrinus]
MGTDNKWMVGVCFCSSNGEIVRHFYVIDGVASGLQARRVAGARARETFECADRQGSGLDARWLQVQRVVRDPLGRVVLSSPLTDEETGSSVESLVCDPARTTALVAVG